MSFETLAHVVRAATFVELVSDEIAAGYRRTAADAELVEVEAEGLTYLFDLASHRTVAAYGCCLELPH